MAGRHEITCVTPDKVDGDRRVEVIGDSSNGSSSRSWRLFLDEAIAGIEAGRWQFWMRAGRKAVNVIVAERKGHKYLKTENDGDEPNDLLSLPLC